MTRVTTAGIEVANRKTQVERSFEERYGRRIVSRGIATFPALILRWQGALELGNGEVVTLGHLLSYYRQRGEWPSVSIDAIADARGVHRSVVEREIAQLEAKGYVAKAGIDVRHRTYRYDFSGLFARLHEFVSVEEQLAELRAEQARIRKAVKERRSGGGDEPPEYDGENSTKTYRENGQRGPNREQEQRSGTEDSQQRRATEDSQQRPLIKDANSVQVQKLAVDDANSNSLETKPVIGSFKYVATAKGLRER